MTTSDGAHCLTAEETNNIKQRIEDVKSLKRTLKRQYAIDSMSRHHTLKILMQELGLHLAKIDALRNRPGFYNSSLYMFMVAVTFNAERRLNAHSEETRRLDEEFQSKKLQYSQELLELWGKLWSTVDS